MEDVGAAARPAVELTNAWLAPVLPEQATPGSRSHRRETPVWVTAHWRLGTAVHEEEIPAVSGRRVGDLVHCRWDDPRLPADGVWMHVEDVERRVDAPSRVAEDDPPA